MRCDMRRLPTSVRNLGVGLVIAAGMSMGSTEMSAEDVCTAPLNCGSLYLSCSCSGPGACSSAGDQVQCTCEGFLTQRCDCVNGCVELPPLE